MHGQASTLTARLLGKVEGFHVAGFTFPSGPKRPVMIVVPSFEIPIWAFRKWPGPRKVNPPMGKRGVSGVQRCSHYLAIMGERIVYPGGGAGGVD